MEPIENTLQYTAFEDEYGHAVYLSKKAVEKIIELFKKDGWAR